MHLLIGAALLIAGGGTAASAKAPRTAPSVRPYLLLGIVGFFLTAPDGGRSPINFLSLNVPDHILHLATALLLLATGLGADHGRTRASEQPEPAAQHA